MLIWKETQVIFQYIGKIHKFTLHAHASLGLVEASVDKHDSYFEFNLENI